MKIKKATRWLAAMACLLMLLALVGCGGGTPTSTPTSTPDSTPASNPGSGDPASEPAGEFNLPGHYDFGGKEIVIKASNGTMGRAYGFQKPGGGEISDMEIRWKAAVEEAYHCTIVKETLIPNDTQNSLVTRILAGEKVADVIAGARYDEEKLRISGHLLKDLASDEIKNLGLDLTDPGWDATLTDVMTYNGKTYGTFVDYPEIQSGCLFFNKDMLNSLGLPDPYQYVKDGKKEWTYDKFIEYCKAATKNGNYGYVTDGEGLFIMYHNNGGWRDITKQPDGKMKYTGFTPEAVATISYLKDNIMLTGYHPPEMGILDYHTMFKEGKVLFVSGPDTYYWVEDKWGGVDFEVGLLPMPIGPNGDDYSYRLGQWSMTFMIPATNDDPEMAVAWMNAYLAYEKAVSPLRIDNLQNNYFANDPDAFDVYMMLKDKAWFDWDIYDTGCIDIYYTAMKVFLHPEESVQATMEAEATRFENMVNDIYNKNL
ncbi:MAG: extracellular solute-binding protein [Clostridia bacterium]|nr:extracellular solute-binding protein [Clostridia bacterium]